MGADWVGTSLADRQQTILDVIRGARRRLDLSLFRCNDADVLDELRLAAARGVAVNVLVTPRAKGKAKKRRKLCDALECAGASVRVYAQPTVKYHAKYMLADEGPAVVASFNLTSKCFERTLDGFVLTYDPDVVAGLRTLIAGDRNARPAPSSITPRLIVGPERSRRDLTSLIAQARSSIRIIDAKLSDPDLVSLLNRRRAEGLTVEVFGSKKLAGLKSHGKMLLIDDRIAVIGSLALTPVSLDTRREVAIVVQEREAVAEVARLFRTIRESCTLSGFAATGRSLELPMAARPSVAAPRQEVLC